MSPRFGDVYFSAVDGLEETRAVFLQGCGLPKAWAGRRRFVVGELGFGTGLNILALLQLWAARRPSPQARLHIFSIEGFPLALQDAARAIGRWPELEALAVPLLDAWPRGRRGLHRIEWPHLGATLDLIVEDVLPALNGWAGAADAWFLDGFAPAKNPHMWSEAVLEAVKARSAPGVRLATFSVAGDVRRGLEAQGFAVERRPGFGRKRQRLEARDLAPAPREPPAPSVAVVGAGIAGAALIRALRRQGLAPFLVEAAAPGAGASGNDAALITPRLDAGGGVAARLHAQAFARAVALYDAETPQAVIARNALQLEQSERDVARFARIAVFEGFDPGAVTLQSPPQIADLLGEPTPRGGLSLADGRVVEPRAVLEVWLADALVCKGGVTQIQPGATGWRLLAADEEMIAEADVVVLAAGFGVAALACDLAFRPVRGQVSTTQAAFSGAPAVWGGYAIPTRTGVLFGASHLRGDAATDVRASEADDNTIRLAEGRPGLAARIARLPPEARAERASIRAALPDQLPVAGPLADSSGLFVLGGLGGRGFTLAPLLAEHVAALIAGSPSPLEREIAAAVSPSRPSARTGGRTGAGTAKPAPRSACDPSAA